MVVNENLAAAITWKGMFECIDDQFGDNQSETDRDIGVYTAAIDAHRDRHPCIIVDHGSAKAFAELLKIAAQLDCAQPRGRKLLLQGRDRHNPVVGIMQMASCFFGLHPPGALHQHTGDDLEAVGDPVLKLLEQYGFLAQQVVLELLADPGLGDVGDRQEQANLFGIAIVELPGIEDQSPGCSIAL